MSLLAKSGVWGKGCAMTMKHAVVWAALAGGLLFSAGEGVVAYPIATELERPAVVVAHPERSALLGITTAGKRLVSVGERGLIIVSDDFGLTWRQVATPVSVTLTAVHFINARSGWAVGHQGVILHSADGGEHWQLQLDDKQVSHLVLAAARAQKMSSNVDPLRYERQLKDAERLVGDGADKPFFDVHFQNDHVGWVVGAYGLSFHTIDGGVTWQPWMQHLVNPDGLHLYAMAGSGQTLYVAGERGLLLRSSDDGQSFHVVRTPYQGSFFTLTSTSSNQLILAGMSGRAYLSEDGGAIWQTLADSGDGSWMASTALSGGRVLLADQFGRLMISQSRTKTAMRLSSALNVPVAAVVQAGDGNMVAVGLRGIGRASLLDRAGTKK